MRILGVDYGDVRTGIALSDPSGFLASAVCVITEKSRVALAQKIGELAIEKKAEKIVLGLPKNMDNTPGTRTEKTLKLQEELERVTGLPIVLRDERNTTISATQILNETNTRGKKRKETIDAVSAVIILQDYLDSQRS